MEEWVHGAGNYKWDIHDYNVTSNAGNYKWDIPEYNLTSNAHKET